MMGVRWTEGDDEGRGPTRPRCASCGSTSGSGPDGLCIRCGRPFARESSGGDPFAEPEPSAPAPSWQKPRKPLTGGVVASIAVALAVLWWSASRLLGGASSPATAAAPATPHAVSVAYRLTGNASAANLTYTDASGNIQQLGRAAVPMRPEIRYTGVSGAFVQFSAQNDGQGGYLDCAIVADGVVVNTGHSSGDYAIVNCSATLP